VTPTYQLHIRVPCPVRIQVGRLGMFNFPEGDYLYTGSARRGLVARVARHLRREKRCRWHIDYLLTHPGVTVRHVTYSDMAECDLNRASGGTIPVPGFGASDCRAGCGSHLRRLGSIGTDASVIPRTR